MMERLTEKHYLGNGYYMSGRTSNRGSWKIFGAA